jgi:DNA-binding NarL/FixJ family response regulator
MSTSSRADDDASVSSVRVLVVEDSDLFRQYIGSTLRKSPELQVIGEAADGLEGVHKAEKLQPDLIVLDIGLPILDGLEAARRIRQVCPESKVVFLGRESDADVQEALTLGAQGYVVKTRAGTELLLAVDEVRRGRQFVSGGVTGSCSNQASFGQNSALDIIPGFATKGSWMETTVRCCYCVSGHEFSPMVAHVDGRYICNQCGHTASPGDGTYECHCHRCVKLNVSSTLMANQAPTITR